MFYFRFFLLAYAFKAKSLMDSSSLLLLVSFYLGHVNNSLNFSSSSTSFKQISSNAIATGAVAAAVRKSNRHLKQTLKINC